MIKKYRYDGDRKFKLSKVETDETSLEPDRKKAEAKMQKNFEEIQELQKKLYAEKKEGVIFLFQAMDAAGKDGTISAARLSVARGVCGAHEGRNRDFQPLAL